MKHSILDLGANDKLLYEDLCRSNHIFPRIQFITQKQVDLLISLRGQIQVEYSKERVRSWKIQGKKKQGGHLTQRFARSFFTV